MNRLLVLRVFAVAAGLSLLLLVLIGYRSMALGQAEGLDVYGSVPAFALTDHLERPVSSDELRGKVVVANFIYTNCTDICPLLSAQMLHLQERLREENLLGGQAQLLSFTTDPARDTPPVLRAFAERYQADPSVWRFLTGPEEQLVPLIVDGFRLGVSALPPKEVNQSQSGHDDNKEHHKYEVMHSGRFVMIDGQGRIRAYYDGRDLDPEQIVSDIRKLLR